ncbi:hypothetical protein F5B19DRAFT_468031 [Rostrohypoxylon terebratum]|nr:hypothetical protein F5B19DRAFT_468031 [Rostrohypoxylon terebratum]
MNIETLTIEPVRQDVDDVGRKTFYPIDRNLTIRGLKEEIIRIYKLQRRTKIMIHGSLAKIPDNAYVLKHISETKIRFVACDDGQEYEEEVIKGPKVKPEHKLNIGDNYADETTKQTNLIQGQIESEGNVDANISKNKATGKATQKNVISFALVNISFD